MGRGQLIADNWLNVYSAAINDANTTAPVTLTKTQALAVLRDYESAIQVEWSSAASVYIVLDFGASGARPNFLALINHNLTNHIATGGAQVTVSVDDDPAMPTPEIISGAGAMVDLDNWYTDTEAGRAPYNTYFPLIDAQAVPDYRYMQIKIDDATRLSYGENIKIGQLLVGGAGAGDGVTKNTYTTTPGWTVNNNYGFREELVDSRFNNVTVGGGEHNWVTAQRWKFSNLAFDALDYSQVQIMLRHLMHSGDSRLFRHNYDGTLADGNSLPSAQRPILYVPDVAAAECFYVHRTGNSLPTTVAQIGGRWNVGPIDLIEQGRGTTV